jgi:hypothetical protein
MPDDLGDVIQGSYADARRSGLDERSAFDAAVATLRNRLPRLSHVRARRLLARALSQGGPSLN